MCVRFSPKSLLMPIFFLTTFHLTAQDSIVLSDRFRVEATWKTPQLETAQTAHGGLLNTNLGYFHFLDPDNIELVIKVLDSCNVNDKFWVFAAGLTDVEVTLTVTDIQTNATSTYFNPVGLQPFSPVSDTSAFDTCPTPLMTASATHPTTHKTANLQGNRFQVSVEFTTDGENFEPASSTVLTNSTAGFSFEPNNFDLFAFVKIIDGRSVNGYFWVYLSSLVPNGLNFVVTDTETNTTKTYEQLHGTVIATIDRQFAAADEHNWVFPWISNNSNFGSRLIVNNYSPNLIVVLLFGARSDGTTQLIQRQIRGGGFLNERASSLFDELGEGPGYTVTMYSSEPGLAARWVTENLNTASSGSPSQGVAVKTYGGEAMENSRNARVGNALMFGFLPGEGDTIAAPVIVNVGAQNADVTLYFFNTDGSLVGTKEIEGLVPNRPFAAVVSDLLPGATGDLSMVAYSKTQPLTGVVFTFNGLLEPSLGNAEAIPFVPPGESP